MEQRAGEVTRLGEIGFRRPNLADLSKKSTHTKIKRCFARVGRNSQKLPEQGTENYCGNKNKFSGIY